MILPCILDGTLSYSNLNYQSGNMRRIVTGFWAGIGSYFLLLCIFKLVFTV